MFDLKKYGGMFGRGLTATFAPSILSGVLVDLFKEKMVDTESASKWVLEDRSIWGSLKPETQRQFKQLVGKLGDISWMDADWAINSLRTECPLLASLFLGWTKGYNWLTRQMETIKSELQS